jgi:NitT/TauT family transport system ATP-binding protein
VLPIPFERPRSIGSLVKSSEFAEIYNELWELFSGEHDTPGPHSDTRSKERSAPSTSASG